LLNPDAHARTVLHKRIEVPPADLLSRVDHARRVAIAAYGSAEKHTFHRMLAGIAAERRYQPGWIAHKYREKFGEWPPTRHVEPLEPDVATRSWVRSRLIAFAKSSVQRQAAS
jgi:DNA repair protein RadD